MYAKQGSEGRLAGVVFLAADHKLAGNHLVERALAHSGAIGEPNPRRQFAVAQPRPR